MKNVNFIDLGKIEYAEAWKYQEDLFQKVINAKDDNSDHAGTFIMCEHPHVFTLGKSGDESNFLIRKDFLKKINATYFKTNRGGDITYHGPGQIVGYPILDLDKLKVSLKEYIYKIENLIINTLSEYQILGEHSAGATGVWLDTDKPEKTRKICAIGVKSSRFVTMHGFAFNVNTDLNYFNYINPCGFTDRGVSSMQKELGKQIDFEEVKQKVLKAFAKEFDVEVKS